VPRRQAADYMPRQLTGILTASTDERTRCRAALSGVAVAPTDHDRIDQIGRLDIAGPFAYILRRTLLVARLFRVPARPDAGKPVNPS